MEEGAIFILSSGLRINGLDNVGKLSVGLNIICLSSLFTKSEKRTISFSTSVPIGVLLKPKGPEKAERLTFAFIFINFPFRGMVKLSFESLECVKIKSRKDRLYSYYHETQQ